MNISKWMIACNKIGIDLEEQRAPMHAIHPLVDGGKSSWDFALDLGGQGGHAKLDGGGNA